MFEIVAILLVMVSPLVVPVAVTIVDVILNWRQGVEPPPAHDDAVRPAPTPSLSRPVPSTA